MYFRSTNDVTYLYTATRSTRGLIEESQMRPNNVLFDVAAIDGTPCSFIYDRAFYEIYIRTSSTKNGNDFFIDFSRIIL